MPKTLVVILLIPLAFYMILRSPIDRLLRRSSGALDWPSIAQGAWTLAFCLLEGGTANRAGFSEAGLYLTFVLGIGVLAVPTLMRVKR